MPLQPHATSATHQPLHPRARGASELVQGNLVQLLDDDGVEGICHALGHAARSDGGVDGGIYVNAAVHA